MSPAIGSGDEINGYAAKELHAGVGTAGSEG